MTTRRNRDPVGLGEIAAGGTLNLAGAAFYALATIAITVIVTRHFSPAAAGAFFTATSLFLIVEAVAGLGAYNGLIYFIARMRSLGTQRRIPAVFRAAMVPVVVTSLLAAALLALLAVPLARVLLGGHLVITGTAPGPVATSLRVLALTLPFAALLDTFLGASRAYRDMLPTVAVERIGRSSLQLLGVLVAALSSSTALLAPLWSLPYLPAAAAAWIWLRRIQQRQAGGPGGPPETTGTDSVTVPADSAELDGDVSGQFWRFTAPRSLAVIAQIIIQRVDIVLVAIIRGPVDAAIYTAATRFLVVGQLAASALNMAAQPQFIHLFAVRDRGGANAVYQATTAWLTLLTWPLYLLAAIFGPTVLILFGRSYRAGATVMVILALSMLVSAACGLVDVVLITTGRSTWSLVNGLLALVVNVAVDLALIPRYGITGAAVGWAAAIVVANLVPLFQVAWVVRVHPFGRGTLAAAGLATISFGVVPLAVRGVLGTGVGAFGVAVLIGGVTLAGGLWRLRRALRLSLLPGATFARRAAARRPPSPVSAAGPIRAEFLPVIDDLDDPLRGP